MTLSQAIIIATNAHNNQVDIGGQPYILHPLRVMLAVQGERERIAAVLHDTPEDAGWERFRDLAQQQGAVIPPWLEDALVALTRPNQDPPEEYQVYVERCGRNPIAKAVKLADLADNMNPARLGREPVDRDRQRFERYQRAARHLLATDGP